MINKKFDIFIELATLFDLTEINEILSDNNLRNDDLDLKNMHIYKLIHKKEIIGTGTLEKRGDYALLRSVAIKENYKNKGLGKFFCNELLKISKEKNIKALYLLTTTAASFFESLGFIECQRESVPSEVQSSKQFSLTCPKSAKCLMKNL